MNWRNLIANERTITIVGSIALGSSGLYAFVLAGIVRIFTGWDETQCLIWVGTPIFIVLLIAHIRLLPERLRKSGLID